LQAFDNLKKQKSISNNSKYNQLASCIAGAITQQTGGNWEVVVFDDASPNAFALPGNKIGVHTGMITLVDNQDQLAAVIGHEIGHVLARHSNERASQELAVSQGMSIIQAVSAPQTALGQTALGLLGVGAQYGILMPYSRVHESEADMIGVDLMAKAGFDPRQSIGLWQKNGTGLARPATVGIHVDSPFACHSHSGLGKTHAASHGTIPASSIYG